MHQTQRRTLLVALAGGLLAGCTRAPMSFHGTDLTGAPYGRDFRLQDPDGRWRTLADFKGRYVLLFFGFTQCPDVCPTALSRAVEVRKALGADRDRVQVIFVTVDPERDTAQLLREYTTAFDPSFLGLRADPSLTLTTAREFRAFYERVKTGSSYTINHTALTYLFDHAGRLRLAHRHVQPASDIADDLRILMRSAT